MANALPSIPTALLGASLGLGGCNNEAAELPPSTETIECATDTSISEDTAPPRDGYISVEPETVAVNPTTANPAEMALAKANCIQRCIQELDPSTCPDTPDNLTDLFFNRINLSTAAVTFVLGILSAVFKNIVLWPIRQLAKIVGNMLSAEIREKLAKLFHRA